MDIFSGIVFVYGYRSHVQVASRTPPGLKWRNATVPPLAISGRVSELKQKQQ
jgi:hypothetical protein